MSIYIPTDDHFIETRAHNYSAHSMHYHTTYELYYLHSYKREYFIRDRFLEVKVGTFILVPPYEFHRVQGSYAKRTLIGFSKEFLLRFFTEELCDELLACFNTFFVTPPKEEQSQRLQLLKNIESSSDDASFALNLAVLLRKLCLDSGAPGRDDASDTVITQIVKYINEHYASVRSLREIADRFYLSESYLCRIFKQQMGETLTEYLNKVKIKHACAYISAGDRKLTEIAALCGFNSSAYFCSVFKKVTGSTPKEYKQHTL